MILQGKLENGAIKSVTPIEDVNWANMLGITDRQTDIHKLYAAVDWVFRCVAIISGATGAIPATISKTGAKEPIWDSDRDKDMPADLVQFKELPALLPLISASYVLLGKAYCLRKRARNGGEVDMRWLMPSSIEPQIGTQGLIAFRRHMNNGVINVLPPTDVLYMWYPDPLVELGEPSVYPGYSAAQAAEIVMNMDKFLSAYFRRGMIKATLFVVKGGMIPEPERERVRSWWTRVTSGLKGAFTTEVINGDGTEIVSIGDGLTELGNAELTNEKREAISTAFGMPHSLVMSNAANYATAEQDVLSLHQNTVIPIAKQLERELNRQLFNPLGYTFSFEYRRIEAIQKSEVAKAQMIQQLTGAPVLTINEGRAMLGYDPIDGGDKIIGVKTPEEEAAAREMEQARMDAMRQAQAGQGTNTQTQPDNRRTDEIKRLGEHIKTGAYLVKAFKSDILTPAEIEGAIIRTEWEAYP